MEIECVKPNVWLLTKERNLELWKQKLIPMTCPRSDIMTEQRRK